MLFSLAETLGTTVAELGDKLTMVELMGWVAHFELREEERKSREGKGNVTGKKQKAKMGTKPQAVVGQREP